MNGQFMYRRLSKNDAAVLLVDHQSGLICMVQDFSPGEFKKSTRRVGRTLTPWTGFVGANGAATAHSTPASTPRTGLGYRIMRSREQ